LRPCFRIACEHISVTPRQVEPMQAGSSSCCYASVFLGNCDPSTFFFILNANPPPYISHPYHFPSPASYTIYLIYLPSSLASPPLLLYIYHREAFFFRFFYVVSSLKAVVRFRIIRFSCPVFTRPGLHVFLSKYQPSPTHFCHALAPYVPTTRPSQRSSTLMNAPVTACSQARFCTPKKRSYARSNCHKSCC